jgi:hypothetical protein
MNHTLKQSFTTILGCSTANREVTVAVAIETA